MPTYQELIDSGRRVIVAVTEEPEQFTSFYSHCELQCKFDWMWSSERHVVSPWGNTTCVLQLRKFLEVSRSDVTFHRLGSHDAVLFIRDLVSALCRD